MNSLTLAVCLKAVWRTDVALRLAESGGVRPDGAVPVLNPADGAALAMALHLRSTLRLRSGQREGPAPGTQQTAKAVAEPRVLAISVGPADWEPVLQAALAAGADEVLRVWPAVWPEGMDASASRPLDGSGARTFMHAALAAAALRPPLAAGALLVLTGESSADEGHGCFGAFLAQALGLGIAHRVKSLEPAPTDERAGWSALVKLERGYTQELTL